MKSDVIVIGGGASGLIAAITAARSGKKVTILEQKDKIGKKILATGNGKCNYTNRRMDESCYRTSDNRHFIMDVLSAFSTDHTIRFFHELGIVPKDKNGYLYPNSEQASSMVEVLEMELRHKKVTVCTNETVREVRPMAQGGFFVVTQNRTYEGRNVILAAGGKASPQLGSDGSGYELCKDLGLLQVPVVPALGALECRGGFFKKMSGVRIQGCIHLLVNGKEIAKDSGEIQLTAYGISGIPTFQISRYAGYALREQKKVSAILDFFPDISKPHLEDMLLKRLERMKDKTAEEAFIGCLNRKLMNVLLERSGILLDMPSSAISRKRLSGLVMNIKGFRVEIIKDHGFEQAQVSAGGLSLKELASKNMAVKKYPGLYVTGELMDVDGICGGYNLHWAWATGYLAGSAIGRKKNK